MRLLQVFCTRVAETYYVFDHETWASVCDFTLACLDKLGAKTYSRSDYCVCGHLSVLMPRRPRCMSEVWTKWTSHILSAAPFHIQVSFMHYSVQYTNSIIRVLVGISCAVLLLLAVFVRGGGGRDSGCLLARFVHTELGLLWQMLRMFAVPWFVCVVCAFWHVWC